MKEEKLLQAMKELDQYHQQGRISDAEYQSAKILLSSQFSTHPPVSKKRTPTRHNESFEHWAAHSNPSGTYPPLNPSQRTLAMPSSQHNRPRIPTPQFASHTPVHLPIPSNEQEQLSELVDALKDLTELHQMGVLTRSEFLEIKQSILSKIQSSNGPVS